MITEVFRHCHGIGPVRLAGLNAAGIRTWHDALAAPDSIPAALRAALLEECHCSIRALEERNVQYFVDAFPAIDKWRILSHFFEDATFFDIETTGLEYDATITVIPAWHQNELLTFVEHENLDDFLDLLEDTRLLVSFNGSSFDVPRVLSGFHIPELPCPHLDLRWPCFHRGFSGSLKQISSALGIHRPADLETADGALAVRLWSDWRDTSNALARQMLIRYCCADVVLLNLVARQLCDQNGEDGSRLWQALPHAASLPYVPPELPRAVCSTIELPAVESVHVRDAAADATGSPDVSFDRAALTDKLFSTGSPQRLRTLRRPDR